MGPLSVQRHTLKAFQGIGLGVLPQVAEVQAQHVRPHNQHHPRDLPHSPTPAFMPQAFSRLNLLATTGQNCSRVFVTMMQMRAMGTYSMTHTLSAIRCMYNSPWCNHHEFIKGSSWFVTQQRDCVATRRLGSEYDLALIPPHLSPAHHPPSL